MLFWIVAAILTLGASLAVLLPLAGRGATYARPQDHDVEVYRDQLAELDRDAARGLIGRTEAEEARAEIARRIIRAAGPATENPGVAATSRPMRAVMAASVLAVPLVSWLLYAELGSPDSPDQPLQARLAQDPADSTIDELVARAESHLAANPNDGRGWEVLAPIYVRMGRFDDAVAAYRNAIRLDGVTAERQASLGEALTNAAGGQVTPEARAAFEHAVTIRPDEPRAGYFLALALAQGGRMDEAASAWTAMLATLPADTPWRGPVEGALAEVERRKALAAAKPEAGPAQADVDAAASMTPEERTTMIETMVASLDQKLRENPRDPEGWMRLVRSYVVLGRTDEARDALGRGIEALDGNSDDGRKLAAFGATVGLATTE